MSSILNRCCSRGWIPPHITLQDVNEWELTTSLGVSEKRLKEIMCDVDIYETVNEISVVTDDVRRWIWMGVPVTYITARSESWTPGVEEVTRAWLQKKGLLDGSLGVHFSRTSKKHLIAERIGIDIYVDDHPIAISLSKVKKAMLFASPWNTRVLPRYQWNEIRSIIDEEISLASQECSS